MPNYAFDPDSYGWICGGVDTKNPCRNQKLQTVVANRTSWKPFGWKVNHCLSQNTPEHCKLQLSQHLLLVVILFNAMKAAIMIFVVFTVKEVPLLTIGDAILSFLTVPNSTTEGMCLVSKEDIQRQNQGWSPIALPWKKTSQPLFRAASVRRWIVCNVL